MNSDKSLHGRRRRARLRAFLICLALQGCGAGQSEQGGQRFELKGKVVSVDKAHQQLVIEHEEIPGFMEAMTMSFTVKERDVFGVVAAGDRIQATLVIADRHSWLENPVITKGGAGDSTSHADDAAQPQAGAEVPDFALVNQDGRAIRLRQYRGRALLVTFIYTRCPLPDYCTLMSTNFAETERELSKNPSLQQKTHLLSVSIDPAYDTPKVLRSYGASHTERYADEKFDRWEFATGEPGEIKRMASFFGLTYFDEKDQIVHSLRTAIVGPDGRVHKIYRGNDWKPAEVVREMQTLLNQS
jgi:protein SCO1/2